VEVMMMVRVKALEIVWPWESRLQCEYALEMD
jgi:hypothetical protein